LFSITRVMPFLMSDVEIAAMRLGTFRGTCVAQSRQPPSSLEN
jgi:hypothetical protein